MVSRPLLVSKPHLGTKARFFILSDSCGFVEVGANFLRGRTENTASDSYSIVVCALCLAMALILLRAYTAVAP
jgi:hypothetical protein